MIPYLERKYLLFAVPADDVRSEKPNDINVRCPICGDSEKDAKKARGHLYIKEGMDEPVYHCFNCEFVGNMYKFLKEVNLDLYEQYKREKREEAFEKIRPKKQEPALPSFAYTKKVKNKPQDIFKLPEQFFPATENERAVGYLKGRKINPTYFYFCPEVLEFRDKKFFSLKNSIIIPLWYNKEKLEIYGFQARSIDKKFFYTYIPEKNHGYKVWNWFSIDKKKPTFIFESVMDALSSGLPLNMITSALGVDLNPERINELTEPIYCLDNQYQDPTSYKKSLKLLEEGKKVFVWPKNIEEKDANELLQKRNIKLFDIMKGRIFQGKKGILSLKLKQ